MEKLNGGYGHGQNEKEYVMLCIEQKWSPVVLFRRMKVRTGLEQHGGESKCFNFSIRPDSHRTNLHTPMTADSLLLLSLQRFYSHFTSFSCLIFRVSSEKHKSGSDENNFLSPLEHQNIWRLWGHFNNRHQYSPPRSDRRRAGRWLQARASNAACHFTTGTKKFEKPRSVFMWKNALRHFMQSRRTTQKHISKFYIVCDQILYLQSWVNSHVHLICGIYQVQHLFVWVKQTLNLTEINQTFRRSE